MTPAKPAQGLLQRALWHLLRETCQYQLNQDQRGQGCTHQIHTSNLRIGFLTPHVSAAAMLATSKCLLASHQEHRQTDQEEREMMTPCEKQHVPTSEPLAELFLDKMHAREVPDSRP